MMNLRKPTISITETQKPPNQNDHSKLEYKVHFNETKITTKVTSKCSEIKKWIKLIQWKYRNQRLIIGLCIQWHPNWKTKKTTCSDDSAADTLQLCYENHCLIIQLTQAKSVPEILRRFLKDPNYTFVGIHNTTDAIRLKQSVHELIIESKLFNLTNYATKHPASITSLAVQFLHLDVTNDTKIGMSNWDAKKLNKDQVQYACVHAHVSFLVAKCIGVQVFEGFQ